MNDLSKIALGISPRAIFIKYSFKVILTILLKHLL